LVRGSPIVQFSAHSAEDGVWPDLGVLFILGLW